MDELITIRGSLARLLDSIVARLPFVFAGLACLMVGVLISRLARSLVSRAGKRARLDPGFVVGWVEYASTNRGTPICALLVRYGLLWRKQH